MPACLHINAPWLHTLTRFYLVARYFTTRIDPCKVTGGTSPFIGFCFMAETYVFSTCIAEFAQCILCTCEIYELAKFAVYQDH